MELATSNAYNQLTKEYKSTYCNRITTIIILSAIIISGIFVGLRSYYTDPFLDDLQYAFFLDRNILGDNESFDHPITGWSDAIGSQYNQYFGSNGRTLVHIIVQMFNGVWGHTAFSVFNGIQFGVLFILFGCLTIPAKYRTNPLLWILIIVEFLYIAQDRGIWWYYAYTSLNYVTPLISIIGLLLIINKLNTSYLPNRRSKVGIVLLAFVTGWSHECYAIPLSGGLFFYLIYNRHKIDKSLLSKLLYVAIPLWIGTTILTLAPGNFKRMDGLTTSHWMMFKEAVGCIRVNYNFILFTLVSIIYIIIKGWRNYLTLLQNNSLYIFTTICACCFVAIAHTGSQSYCGVSFFFGLLAFMMLSKMLGNINQMFSIALSSTLLVLISLNQIRIVETTQTLHKINQQFIADYIASTDGKVQIPQKPNIPTDVEPFVMFWFTSGAVTWQLDDINKYYYNRAKPITLIDHVDNNNSE